MRLKSRTLWPPHGFQMLFPSAGMAKPFEGSFTEVVTQTMAFLRKNPALVAKNKWPTDQADVEAWVDEENARRMLAHGWYQFVADETPMSLEKKTSPGSSSRSLFQRARHAAAAVKSAALAYKDLFSNGPVPRETAEKRAAICVRCPQNNVDRNLTNRFTEGAAAEIVSLINLVKDMNISTSQDEFLGVCDACLCPMAVKCHVRIQRLVKDIPDNVWPKLEREKVRCWILDESGRE